jgi:hypothetical protein
MPLRWERPVTVSTQSNWNQTVGQICLSAAMELGAVGIGGTLESAEELEMQNRLNSMLAKWSLKTNLFREASGTVTVDTTGILTMDANQLGGLVRDIRSARQVLSANNKSLLTPWNRDEYFQIPNRAQTGANPIAYYLSSQVDAPILYVWPVPTSPVTIELDYNRSFYFAQGPEQNLDVPPEWHEAVLYGLASRSAGIFGTTALDPTKVARCDAQAKTSYEEMLDADRPDSYYFEYDSPVEVR